MPEVDGLLRGAGEEETGVKGVPDDRVDGRDVGVVGHDEGGGVLGGAEVDVTLLSPDQVQRIIVRLEGNRPNPVVHVGVILLDVLECLGEVDPEEVRVPERGLDYSPVCDSAVSRATEEIEISVQVIFGPLHLNIKIRSRWLTRPDRT